MKLIEIVPRQRARLYGTLVEGPMRAGGSLYRLRLSETKLPRSDVDRIVHRMQEESKVVAFIAAAD